MYLIVLDKSQHPLTPHDSSGLIWSLVRPVVHLRPDSCFATRDVYLMVMYGTGVQVRLIPDTFQVELCTFYQKGLILAHRQGQN